MKKGIFILSVSTLLGSVNDLAARENVGQNSNGNPVNVNVLSAFCTAAKAKTDLDINNVRTTMSTCGMLWNDLSGAIGSKRYEIPKNSKQHSIFSGALWIGGYDNSSLKMAAMTYRQSGNDFWPGPLDTTNASVDKTVCDEYDKHFKMTRKEVDDFVLNGAAPTADILNWPGNGDVSKNQSKYLAPFFDKNGNGIYEPGWGDYPDYNVTNNSNCTSQLYGDQTLWWVFNDKGNIHSETSSNPIGLEVHAQAFAFNSNDEINDMTFNKYKIINRSSFKLDSCYFGVWVDADLGNYTDDFVGCDVANGLGYCYNGDGMDGSGAPGEYGNTPPAVGVDFFEGPIADLNDGIDNNRNDTTDEAGEQIIMSKFMYYDNISGIYGNPFSAQHFYNYLAGRWGDGSTMTYGGTGHGTGTGATTIPCNFMFPGTSDDPLKNWGTNGVPVGAWDEVSAGNTPADRRFIQSAGKFTLAAGAVNYITTGVVWARTTVAGGNIASVLKMRVADKKAQALFNSCFNITNGPDAPELVIQEMSNQLLLYLTNPPSSNNYKEAYSEKDPVISGSNYTFQGYKIYQIKNESVSVSELNDFSKARLVKQMDVKDAVSQIINYEYKIEMQNSWEPKEMVNGENAGIFHSLVIEKDLFASGDDRLVNHKQYYYMAVAYAYNPAEVPPNSNPFDATYKGLGQAYLQGRNFINNVSVYTAIPHDYAFENDGTHAHSSYSEGPKITRIEGQGNGGNVLDFAPETYSDILAASDHRTLKPVYDYGKGPISVRVVDPLNVPEYSYEIKFTDATFSANWILINLSLGDTIKSDKSIAFGNEQLLMGKKSVKGKPNEFETYNWGIAITVQPVPDPGSATSVSNGYLESSITFSDPSKNWLTGLVDSEPVSPAVSTSNWIRSGTAAGDYTGYDNGQDFEKMVGSTWAPYRLCSVDSIGPVWNNGAVMGAPSSVAANRIGFLASVDVIITPDQSKWSRCPVLDASVLASNGSFFDLRKDPSVDKNGNADGTGTGMGWFPGYAVNLETGERLNIAFAEDTTLASDNGDDMKWNPTSVVRTSGGKNVWGGKHTIIVFNHNGDERYTMIDPVPELRGERKSVPRYDSGQAVRKILAVKQVTKKRDVFRDAMWVTIPLLKSGHSLLESEVKVRLRVQKPYRRAYSAHYGPSYVVATPSPSVDSAAVHENKNFPMYRFNTANMETHVGDMDEIKDNLYKANIVPNPYYAYSEYETNQVDNRVKIVNLPERCTISIYTVNGTLIKKIKKDDPLTSIDWDLRNNASIPIASGLYIIHIDAGEAGEKILKWFGVMRTIDLDAF